MLLMAGGPHFENDRPLLTPALNQVPQVYSQGHLP